MKFYEINWNFDDGGQSFNGKIICQRNAFMGVSRDVFGIQSYLTGVFVEGKGLFMAKFPGEPRETFSSIMNSNGNLYVGAHYNVYPSSSISNTTPLKADSYWQSIVLFNAKEVTLTKQEQEFLRNNVRGCRQLYMQNNKFNERMINYFESEEFYNSQVSKIESDFAFHHPDKTTKR